MSDLDLNDTLAGFADLDLDNFTEIRSELLPQGTFGFEVKLFEFDPEATDYEDNACAKAVFTLEIIEVQALLKPAGIDTASLIGKNFYQKFTIMPEDLPKGVGRIKGFLSDIGAESGGKFMAACEGAVGTRFMAGLTHGQSRDKSVTFARLKLASKKQAAAGAGSV